MRCVSRLWRDQRRLRRAVHIRKATREEAPRILAAELFASTPAGGGERRAATTASRARDAIRLRLSRAAATVCAERRWPNARARLPASGMGVPDAQAAGDDGVAPWGRDDGGERQRSADGQIR